MNSRVHPLAVQLQQGRRPVKFPSYSTSKWISPNQIGFQYAVFGSPRLFHLFGSRGWKWHSILSLSLRLAVRLLDMFLLSFVQRIQWPSSTPWTSISYNRNACGVQGDGTTLRTTSQSENQKLDTRCYIQWSYSQTRFRCGKTRLFVNSDEIRAWCSSVLLLHLYFVTVEAFVKHKT